MATGEPEDWKSRFECVADDVIALRVQLQQAERQALLNLGQAWQREDITQAQLRQAQDAAEEYENRWITAGQARDTAIERAEAAEALVARLKEAAIRRVVRSAKPRLWCCGLCGDWWADGEAPCHTNTCVLYLAPTEAQARQKEGDRAGNLLSRHQH